MNDLHGRRRELREAEKEHNAFRLKHRLQRTAQVKDGPWQFVKWALLGFLLVVEAVLNGTFLAKGNEQGFLGGFSEAFGFAFVNIGAAYLLARGTAQLAHRNLIRKFGGLVSAVLYLGLAILLNLSLAHYREITALLVEGGGRLVMQRLQTAPFGLEDFTTWIFFSIGLIFSVIAFMDGLSMSDPYPGFAGVQKRLTEKRDAYSEEASRLIDDLGEIRDRYREEMDELNRDLSVRRGEHDVILSSRSRLIQLFDQHQTQIERAGNSLLSIYREANVRPSVPMTMRHRPPGNLPLRAQVTYRHGNAPDQRKRDACCRW
ncbi:hypothetical protein VSX62_26210, partial [Aurantimonas sp. C2-3-R2]|nr:hypothetical protein [Aurantimonas sp. C2-3-R2]